MLSPDYSAYATPVCRDKLIGYANRGPDYCDFDRQTPTQLNKYPGWVEGIWYGLLESDFIAGSESHETFPLAVEALRTKAGFSAEELERILGGNLLRVYRTVLS
jgi:microsomal dipeptidase-like Zn-dependent dipeptidase